MGSEGGGGRGGTMRSKGIYIAYAIFFIICFIIFVSLNQVLAGQSRQHSDAILVALVTVFSAFLVYYDFHRRLPASQIIAPVIVFALLNIFMIGIIYFTKFSLSGAFIIPFFMVEGALVYWWLEKRASALED
jgi:uncharacterized membrane protein YoaK (UPF0700 family)